MADNTKVVLAPLVQLKVRDAAGAWVFRQFYSGAVLDLDEIEIEEDNLQSHLDSGQIVELDTDVAKVFAVPAGTPLPGQPPNTEVTEASSTAQPLPPLSAGQLRAADIDASGDEAWAAESTDPPVDEDFDNSTGGRKPDGRASEARWRDYHARQLVAQGQDEDDAKAEADSKSKAQLVQLYR